MKKAIFMAGLPGSGKTTIASHIAYELEYYHFEFDKAILNKNFDWHKMWSSEKLVLDCWYKGGTDDLLDGLRQAKRLGFDDITVIHVNTPKDKCIENAKQRDIRLNATTADITNETSTYDFERFQKEVNFHLITVVP